MPVQSHKPVVCAGTGGATDHAHRALQQRGVQMAFRQKRASLYRRSRIESYITAIDGVELVKTISKPDPISL
jgi:hypothetical protein